MAFNIRSLIFATLIGAGNVLGVHPSVAEPPQVNGAELLAKGARAESAKDYVSAARYYRQAMAAGNVEAEYDLGFLYQMNLGVARDPNAAVKLFTAAANAGYTKAMSRAAEMYFEPDGIPQNLGLARKWAEAAAQRGDAKGSSLLGYMFDNGVGAPKDKCAALKWYRKAEDGGVNAADVYVGTIYAAGQCGPANWVLARHYFERSASQGVELARISLHILNRLERQNLSSAYANALMAGVSSFVESLGSSGGQAGSESDDNARFNMWVQKNRNEGLNDNGTPK